MSHIAIVIDNQLFIKTQEKIKKGLELSYQRLVEKTKKENGSLIFSINGKIVEVAAKDL